jgi:hypothetical protein
MVIGHGRTSNGSYGAATRQELCHRNAAYATHQNLAHVLNYGEIPVVVYGELMARFSLVLCTDATANVRCRAAPCQQLRLASTLSLQRKQTGLQQQHHQSEIAGQFTGGNE